MNPHVFLELSIHAEELRLKAFQAVADHRGEIASAIEEKMGRITAEDIEAEVGRQIDAALHTAIRDEVQRQVYPAIKAWLAVRPPEVPTLVERAVKDYMEKLT